MRLFQGDYARETAYSDDPVAVARRWESLGAPRLHVVDLDGAKDGAPAHEDLMARICAAISIPVEVSGGMRTLPDISRAFAYGATRVQVGSAAVKNPDLVREAAAAHPGGIVVSIDARNGEVMTDGWLAGSGVDALALAQQMAALGVPRIMVTDIGRDGAMSGPNIEVLTAFVQSLDVPVVASGGVTTIDHLRALAAAGCEGAIVGKALYEGAIDLAEALRELQPC